MGLKMQDRGRSVCWGIYAFNMREQVLVLQSVWIYSCCFLSDVKVSSFGAAMPDM